MSERRQVFTDAKTGETFVGGGFGGDIFHSPDGKIFYQLKMAGFSGSNNKHELTALDPHSGMELKIEVKRDGSIVSYDGRTLSLLGTFDTATPVVPLPTVRVYEYLFQSTTGKPLVYVSVDKYTYSYESFKLFVGSVGVTMNQIHVKNVERYRDGGTTYVYTEKGILFSPARQIAGKDATWNGEKVVRLDPKDYDIAETNEGVVMITKKAQ